MKIREKEGGNMYALYLGTDSEWANGVLAKALGQTLETARSETEAMYHGTNSYDLIFIDLTGIGSQSWANTISQLWHQGLRVVAISPQPDWSEVRLVMRAGGVGYIGKKESFEELEEEIARAKNTPAHHPR